MNTLFTTLSEAMFANIGIAIAASFAWGILSILLSPCHLSSIPLIVGFLASQNNSSTKRNLGLSLVFAAGILLTIALVGLITAMMGRMLGDVGPYGKYLVAVVFFGVGLHLMDILHLPDFKFGLKPLATSSAYLRALGLGIVFGFALGPCTFAFMAPVLGVVFNLASSNPLGAGILLFAFALGHCVVIVVVGMLTTRIQVYLDWTNRSNTIIWIKRIAGVLVILGGIYLVMNA